MTFDCLLTIPTDSSVADTFFIKDILGVISGSMLSISFACLVSINFNTYNYIGKLIGASDFLEVMRPNVGV